MEAANMELPRLSDLDLPFEASGIMAYHEVVMTTTEDNRLVVGYLSDDSHCENPLTSCDGMGAIYTAHRHASKDEHRQMQEALGLNGDGEPDLETGVVESITEAKLKQLLLDEYTVQMVAWSLQYSAEGFTPSQLLEDIQCMLEDGYCRTNMEFDDEDQEVLSEIKAKYSDMRQAAWEEARTSGKLGKRDAVILDCYEHGGQHWSVSGSGMQCQWDTSGGAGVWVPDDSCLPEIERRGAVYRKGRIKFNNGTRGNEKYSVLTFRKSVSGGDTIFFAEGEHPVFDKWEDAFEYLSAFETETLVSEDAGRQYAAEERARECLESYNDWLAGSCYGVVIATFANIAADGDDPEWEFVESAEFWGYIGDDNAMNEVESGVKYAVESNQRQALLAA